MTSPSVIRLHPEDGVVIARATLLPGARWWRECRDGRAHSRRPQGRGARASPPGEPMRRYGQIIGFATAPIAPGQHVHVHNCGMGDFAKDYAYGVDATPDATSSTRRRPSRASAARTGGWPRATTSAS